MYYRNYARLYFQIGLFLELFMELILLVLVIFFLYISFYVGKIYGISLSSKYMKSLLFDKGFKQVNITITKNNDSYLVHGAETNEFITQGKNKKEVLESLAIRFPLTHFMVDKNNLKEVGFISESI